MRFLNSASKTTIGILFLSLLLSGVVLMYSIITGFDTHIQSLNIGIRETAGDVGIKAKDLIKTIEPLEYVFTGGEHSDPIVATESASQTLLTPAGILTFTNVERTDEGLNIFSGNTELDSIAEARLADMFKKQYFAHYSPSGEGAGDIAKQIGYDFLAIGENIALGNFGTDQNVVTAWMNSPGHRANILKKTYTELGVAAAQGFFNGQETWIAVQIFGTPAHLCNKPNQQTLTTLNTLEVQVNKNEAKAKQLKTQLDQIEPITEEEVRAHNMLVQQYNDLVQALNKDIDTMQNLAGTYNAQANLFNTCIANYTS